jgi:hypothetical protein
MSKAKYLLVFITAFIFLVAAGPSSAKGLRAASDVELDGVSARGLDFLFDANSLMSGSFWGMRSSSGGTTPFNLTFNGTNNLTLANSIMLSGSSQSGLGVVNAVNSSVNMPINITILINSSVSGGINLSNFLSSIRPH